ncbi:MAG: type II toxin-antitoxin system Phd/YefM family antitoxin [Candidatus Sumerlaeota bacterium]|nr:type II toxin-antitoxin system Phd/YefM family antitoxin [Candidatus Sumerlaeota bacterium]
MKPIQLATDVVSVGELKVQAARLFKRIHQDRRPIVITQHGKPAAVLLAPEDYDRLAEQTRFIEAVRQGLSDSEAGRVIADSELDADIDAVLGPRRVR